MQAPGLAGAQVREARGPLGVAALHHADGRLHPSPVPRGMRASASATCSRATPPPAARSAERARQAEYAHLPARAQALRDGGALQQLARVGRDAEALQLGELEPGIGQLLPARSLPVARSGDAGRDDVGRLGPVAAERLGVGGVDADDEVETVDQRAAEAGAVALDALVRAGAAAEAAAGAGVGGGDQLHARRKAHTSGRARDDQLAVLERLPQGLERTARELRELVEEEHAAGRQ